MKIVKLKNYERKLYQKIEKCHNKSIEKKKKQGFEPNDSDQHNLKATPIYIDEFRWKYWPDVNLYRLLFSLRLLEDVGVVVMISEHKFKFIGGGLPE